MDQVLLQLILNIMITNPNMTLDTVVTNPTLIKYMQEQCNPNTNKNYAIIKKHCEGGLK